MDALRPKSLGQGRYTWRHNKVLQCILTAVEKRVNSQNTSRPTKVINTIPFVRSGEKPKKTTRGSRTTVLGQSTDWEVRCDLKTQLVFPVEVAITNQRPDMVVWSREGKKVVLIELTCPWEENAEEAHERKLLKYEDLKATGESNGWKVSVFAVEVCCRGYASDSLRKCLFALGISNNEIRRIITECCEIAERCSMQIFISRDKEWEAR